MELQTVKISPQGQITIPHAVRLRYGLNPGQKAQLVLLPKALELKPEPDSWVDAAYGIGQDLWKEHGGVDKYHAAEKKSWDR